MPRRAREPLSTAEVEPLPRRARSNALPQQGQAERVSRQVLAATALLTSTPSSEAGLRPLRILIVSDVFFPRINGVSTSIASFRRGLEHQGHSVTLICPDYPLGQTDAPEVLRIPSRGVPGDPEDRMMHYRELMALTPQLAAEAFDLIHVHTPFVAHYAGIALGRRLGIPVVATYHTLFEEYLHHYVRWLPRRWLRFAARRLSVRQCHQLDALVAPSRAMREALERYGVTTPMAIIPTGLALETFTHPHEASDFRHCYGLPSEARLLLFVGRAANEKNIGFLIEMLPRVLAQHPATRLIITGEGPAQAALARQAQQAGLGEAVIFLGYLDRDGPLQAAYRAADVFVFASRTETQGLVLLEALALGTPVVSTAVMGTRDMLEDGAGCLIAEERHDDFADKVNRVLSEPALKAELARRGPIHAARWHEDTLAAELAWVYWGCVVAR
ncbi:glycosyltransferase [Halomonas sp. M4R1S46]|uniref:glycosyltransferase n=1 Tax=Halomonas sp. M4R1S46 TaxID=2982692 RepID=UPI0021E4DF50|nr:glycosyltransferase [Halomonas sp. M4R1S46]UYG07348.1 glycosyltransferase [Halomonas sp. M4R1S46]